MTFSCFVRDSNKRPFSKFKGERLFESGLLSEGGRLLNNFTFRVGAYPRGRLFEALRYVNAKI